MSALPPGPRFPPLQTLRFFRNVEDFFLGSAHRYGDPFTASLLFGTSVVTGDPKGVKEIFTAPPDVFAAFTAKGLKSILGDHSLIMLEGETHRREKELLMPPFHGERMRAYGELMQRITLEHTNRWRPGPLVAHQTTQAIALDVILEAVFGIEPARVETFRKVVNLFFSRASPLFLTFSFTRTPFLGVGPWDRFQQVAVRFDQLLQEEIDRRRREQGERQDILSLLLSARDEDGQPLSDSDLKDELRTLILAGHETTALTLAWALYWIHRKPAVKEKLLDELAALGPTPAPEAVMRLPYLDAVCNEALRLHPVLPYTGRKVAQPFTLLGQEVPVGTGVIVCAVVTHHNPAIFPEPFEFRPERFLSRRYSPFEYYPFGGGSRRCLGASFATYEMKIVLSTLMARHRLALESNRPLRVVRRNVAVGPEGGVRMVYEGSTAGGQETQVA